MPVQQPPPPGGFGRPGEFGQVGEPGEPGGSGAPATRDPGSRVLRWASAAALIGVFLIYNSLHAGSPQPAVGASAPSPVSGTAAASAAAKAAAAATARAASGPVLPPSVPTHLSIPAIGVSAPFTPLSLGADGVLQPPPENDTNLAGYYAAGPMPGERGAAIIAGHVDTRTGPAVFLMLSLLKPKDTVSVTRADGTTAVFTIDSVENFSRKDFPDERVYGDTPDAELRVITCGGTFDHAKQEYEANTVVFAHLTSSTKAPG